MNRIEALVRPNIRSLCPYATARDEYKGPIGIFLDANESPYATGWNRYPDPRQTAVKTRLSELKGLPIGNMFIGNGSDEAIDLVFRVFCEPGKDNAVMIAPSYGMYSVCATINDVEVREVALGEDFSLPVDKLFAACDERTKLMFICSPNNPSGNAYDPQVLLDIASRFSGILIVDEAYADFSSLGSISKKVLECDNLIILQTLSKAWGLAALRCGLAFSSEYIIRLMSMVKYPYNINQATQNEVLKALAQPIGPYVKEIIEERARVAEELTRFSIIKKIYPSEANFILAETCDANAIYAHLIADGIIVRNRDKVAPGCLRITIGLKSENDRLLASLEDYEKGNIRR